MLMEMGLLFSVGMIPVIVIIAIFEVCARRRSRDLRAERNWQASRDLRAPE
jgi:hypothetical protein